MDPACSAGDGDGELQPAQPLVRDRKTYIRSLLIKVGHGAAYLRQREGAAAGRIVTMFSSRSSIGRRSYLVAVVLVEDVVKVEHVLVLKTSKL